MGPGGLLDQHPFSSLGLSISWHQSRATLHIDTRACRTSDRQTPTQAQHGTGMSPDCDSIVSCKEVLRKSSLSATRLFTYMQTHTFTGILAHCHVHSICVHVYAQERVCAHTQKHVYKMIMHTCDCVNACTHVYKHMCVYLCIHISFRWTLTCQHVSEHVHICVQAGACRHAHICPYSTHLPQISRASFQL